MNGMRRNSRYRPHMRPSWESQVLTSVITATPFRVSFFGGGTDFPGYFDRRGGVVRRHDNAEIFLRRD